MILVLLAQLLFVLVHQWSLGFPLGPSYLLPTLRYRLGLFPRPHPPRPSPPCPSGVKCIRTHNPKLILWVHQHQVTMPRPLLQVDQDSSSSHPNEFLTIIAVHPPPTPYQVRWNRRRLRGFRDFQALLVKTMFPQREEAAERDNPPPLPPPHPYRPHPPRLPEAPEPHPRPKPHQLPRRPTSVTKSTRRRIFRYQPRPRRNR